MPDRHALMDLLLALRDVGVAEPPLEALDTRVRSELAREADRERRLVRRHGQRIRPSVGGLFTALSVAVTIAIAVGAIALLSHKPMTAARSTERRGIASHPSRNQYEPVGAQVIERDPSLWYKTIEVDKGSQDGVAVNDPVIGDGALVGKISRVGVSYSIVSLITDPSFAVAGRAQNPAASDTGVLVSKVGDPNVLLLQHSPSHAQITIGQRVVTAGFRSGGLQSIFPAGIPIGQVSNANPFNHGQVQVTPAADVRHLAAVQILTVRHGSPATGTCYVAGSCSDKPCVLFVSPDSETQIVTTTTSPPPIPGSRSRLGAREPARRSGSRCLPARSDEPVGESAVTGSQAQSVFGAQQRTVRSSR